MAETLRIQQIKTNSFRIAKLSIRFLEKPLVKTSREKTMKGCLPDCLLGQLLLWGQVNPRTEGKKPKTNVDKL